MLRTSFREKTVVQYDRVMEKGAPPKRRPLQ
jgi:hypothetical protein